MECNLVWDHTCDFKIERARCSISIFNGNRNKSFANKSCEIRRTMTFFAFHFECLENSDHKNADPLGVSKTQTLKTQTLRKLENSNPNWENKFYTACATDYYKPSCFSKTLKYRIVSWICRKNKTARAGKYLHWSRTKIIFNVSPNPLKFNCVTVSQPAHVCPASDSGYS